MNFISNIFKKLFQTKPIQMEMLVPSTVAEMKVLDRDAFNHKLSIPTLIVPIQQLKNVMKSKTLKSKLMKFGAMKDLSNVSKEMEYGGNLTKCKFLCLKPGSSLSEEEIIFLESIKVDTKLVQKEIELKYENYSHSDIFKAVLANDEESLRGFSQIGHIIHLNLRDSLLPYNKLIGQVLLDKCPRAKTVVNKSGIIDSTFRNFQLDLLAGEEDFVVSVAEHGTRFQFDFSKVFWNPRLSNEHTRVVEMTSSDDVIFDAFAGVGPFAIPLAKKGCDVFANDLNPDSVAWLKSNAALNKTSIKVFNSDARDFFKQQLVPLLLQKSKEPMTSRVRVLMNLPQTAIEFISVFHHLVDYDVIKKSDLKNQLVANDEFREYRNMIDDKIDLLLFRRNNLEVETLPPVLIHLYHFAPKTTTIDEFREAISSYLNIQYDDDINVHRVRNVAPNKEMFSLIFSIDHSILCQTKSSQEETVAKKRRLK